MLVELGLVEQRYKAVCEVLDAATVTDVARRNGVARQTVYEPATPTPCLFEERHCSLIPSFLLSIRNEAQWHSFPSPGRSREPLDDLDHLIGPVTLGAAEIDQVPDPIDHSAALRRPGHGDPPPPLEIEQALVTEDAESSQHGVLVHPEDGRHVLGQGQPLPRSGLAVGDGTADLGGHLVVEWDRLSPVDVDIKHGAIHSSPVSIGLRGLA
jgi:hypothetical protein